MNSLSKKALLDLRKKAHALKPVILIGQHGLTESVFAEIEVALEHHELIKIKAAGIERDEFNTVSDEICQKLDAILIQKIGRVITIYREAPED